MEEELYPLIFVLLIIVAIVIDTWIITQKDHRGCSELHAADRYAVAEEIEQ